VVKIDECRSCCTTICENGFEHQRGGEFLDGPLLPCMKLQCGHLGWKMHWHGNYKNTRSSFSELRMRPMRVDAHQHFWIIVPMNMRGLMAPCRGCAAIFFPAICPAN